MTHDPIVTLSFGGHKWLNMILNAKYFWSLAMSRKGLSHQIQFSNNYYWMKDTQIKTTLQNLPMSE
jgi:hypothetical protein